MPRAGGSYVYASRGLSPYLGFVASFSQWFGLSIAIGVVSYLIPAFLRDIALPLELGGLAAVLDGPVGRPVIALAILWTFVLVNLRGTQLYERLLIPLMVLMFLLGGVVIVAGFAHDHTDFAAALLAREGRSVAPGSEALPGWRTLLAATPVLFASFIGFDSIAQAGGEAKNPTRALPLAIGLSVFTVGAFYLLFTAAVYHAVPWSYVAEQSLQRDVTAPGLLGLPALARVDGGDRGRRRRGADQRPAGDAAGRLAPHVRLVGGRDLSRAVRAHPPRVAHAAPGDHRQRCRGLARDRRAATGQATSSSAWTSS